MSRVDLHFEGGGRIGTSLVEEPLLMHRKYGLQLAARPGLGPSVIVLNGSDIDLVTELVRLAHLGSMVEAAADRGSTASLSHFAHEADTAWKLGMKP